jgi:hypothetical protein
VSCEYIGVTNRKLFKVWRCGEFMKTYGISEGLYKEIEKKLYALEDMDVFKRVLKCQNLRKKVIEENSQIHSYRIEHPTNGVPFCVPRNKCKREIKKGIWNIKDAFNWGLQNFDQENFRESLIRGIAQRITPELYENSEAQYRSNGTAIKGASVTPPYPEKLVYYEIPWFENFMNRELKCPKIRNQIETAIFAHLHLARMHPFKDGNGRTSRTMQDVILDEHGIPLPVIEAGERMTYYQLLDGAVDGWKDRNGRERGELSNGEKLFYDFIAGKINLSLDKIINSCYHSLI